MIRLSIDNLIWSWACHFSPSTLGMAGEERHKSLLALVLFVCIIGSAFSSLLMTLSEGFSQEISTLAEAQSVEFELLSLHSWPINTSRVFWQCTPQTLAKPIIEIRQ